MKISNLKFAIFCPLFVGMLAFLTIEKDQNLAADDYGFSNEVNSIEGLKLAQNDADLDLEIRTDKYTMEKNTFTHIQLWPKFSPEREKKALRTTNILWM